MPNPYTQFGEIRPSRKLIAEKLEGKEFESVLEVGAQWGENLVWLRDKFPGKKYVGVDIDWDNILEDAQRATGLDLRKGDVRNLEFEKDEFDVVVTNALFCMLEPEEVEKSLQEVLRVAKKHIVLVELETVARIGRVRGSRTGADWTSLLEEKGWKVKREKVRKETWDAEPWISYGYVYEATR